MIKKSVQPTPNERSLGYTIWQVNNELQRRYRRALQPFDLTFVQYQVLKTLTEEMNRATGKQKYVIKKVGADRAMLSSVIRTLLRKQLIFTWENPNDRRATALRVHQQTITMLKQADAAMQAVDAVIQKELDSESGAPALMKALRKLI